MTMTNQLKIEPLLFLPNMMILPHEKEMQNTIKADVEKYIIPKVKESVSGKCQEII